MEEGEAVGVVNEEVKVSCEGTELLDLDSIEIFQGDLKNLTIENYTKLRGELLRNGIISPWHIWRRNGKYYVLDGTQRTKTLREMKEEGVKVPTKIPVVYVDARDEAQANDLVLALTSQFGEMSDESLSKYIKERNLKVTEVVERFRFPETDTENVIRICDDSPKSDDAAPRDGGDEDAVPEPAVDPRVSRGDVFILGQHVLMCGDSSNEGDVAVLMGYGGVAEKADMVFTDPPYNLASHASLPAKNIRKSYDDLADSEWDKNFEILPALQRMLSVLAEDASVYVCTSHFLAGEIWKWMSEWSSTSGSCVWVKSNPMPSLTKRHWTWATELICYATRGKHTFNFPDEGHALNVWNIAKNPKNDLHPTQKPVAVPEHAILHSSKPGDLVLDLFGGSGTTLIAATKTSRRCRMMEIEPKYVRCTIERWEKLTGRVAEKASA